jgi:hypothetical protein
MANRINPLLFALLAWALVIAPAANAVVVKVIAAGSFAQWLRPSKGRSVCRFSSECVLLAFAG